MISKTVFVAAFSSFVTVSILTIFVLQFEGGVERFYSEREQCECGINEMESMCVDTCATDSCEDLVEPQRSYIHCSIFCGEKSRCVCKDNYGRDKLTNECVTLEQCRLILTNG